MSLTSRDANKNQIFVDKNSEKIFLRNCEYISLLFKNTTGGPLTLTGGELIGRDSTTLKGAILASAAADGSQFPLGINATPSEELADDDEINIMVCVSGDVNEGSVILDGADTLDTLVSLRPIRDRIAADTQGVHLVFSDELTDYDN